MSRTAKVGIAFRKNVRSGPDGRYELSGLGSGEYTLYARAGTGSSQMARVTARVVDGETLELDLQAPARGAAGDVSPRSPSR